ncbi:hypothetical protein [Mesorhizobium sp. M0910]|uniref:hypothetical protein n=1 Tax=Mesorhizobium sp. M0910 TaxID=2957025 RepID=UPI003339DAA2
MSAEVAALDAALARAGEDITLRRKAGTGANQVNIDVTCRAAVRGVSANEIVGTVTQTSSKVILSPTQILAAQWPGGLPVSTVTERTDPRIPRANDFAVIKGKQRQILFVSPIFVGGEWARCEMTVEG